VFERAREEYTRGTQTRTARARGTQTKTARTRGAQTKTARTRGAETRTAPARESQSRTARAGEAPVRESQSRTASARDAHARRGYAPEEYARNEVIRAEVIRNGAIRAEAIGDGAAREGAARKGAARNEVARPKRTARPQTTTVRSALAAGFRKSFSAVADSNITTLIAAALLFFLASGPVRGFGITLGIGVLASMFSALVITRVLADLTVHRRAVRTRPTWSGIAGDGRVRTWLARRNPHLMRRPRRWLAVSAVAVILSTCGIAARGLDFGVEFTGGRLIEYSTSRPVDADRARAALADAGLPRAVVNTSTDGELTLRTGKLSDAQESRIRQTIGGLGGTTEKVRDELIGPSLGDELRTGALIALATALLAQLLYLAIRFRLTYATAAVTAMAHDVLILVGVFAWLGKPVDGVFLAALLTVIGYSVNDSVVVFDRVRELTTANPTRPFAEVANTALLQTVPRTVNTGMGAVFILAALALLGGDTLTDFALALLIGITVGTCSSVFTATPLAIVLHHHSHGEHDRK